MKFLGPLLFLTAALSLHGEKKIIQPPEFAGLKTPFSFGILVDGTLYISGQMGRDPKTNKIPDDFVQEAKACLERIGLILKAAGMKYEDVVSVQVLLTDVKLRDAMSEVYLNVFHAPLPTRTSAVVSSLADPAAHIEITVVAHK